jgi:hypothetical protein
MLHSLARRVSGLTLQAALIVVPGAAVLEATRTDESQAFPRVRSESSLVTDAIVKGVDRSPTFRRLVESIDATDGLVYVEAGTCGHSVRACLHLSMVVPGPYRILRILVDPRKARGCELIEAIGHELHHAVEVLGNPRIRSTSDLFFLFHRIGQTSIERFETDEAVRAGVAIRQEACRDDRKRRPQ